LESHHGRQGRQGRRLVRGEGGGEIVVDLDAPLTRFAATHVLLEAMSSPLMVWFLLPRPLSPLSSACVQEV